MVMKIDLRNTTEDDIRKIYQYPDGQQQVVLKKYPYFSAHIISSIRSWKDIELIYCTVASIKTANPDANIRLDIMYLLGARSDRSFEGLDNNYVRDVIGNLLNSLPISKIGVLHPHSLSTSMSILHFEHMMGLLKGFYKFVIKDLGIRNGVDELILIGPDAGSESHVNTFRSAEYIYMRKGVVIGKKVRNPETGKPSIQIDTTNAKKGIVIDDICDGGRTFIELAQTIRETNPDIELHLVVTHGIFSKGFEELKKHYKTIYTTDSYRTIGTTYNDGYNNKPTQIIQYELQP